MSTITKDLGAVTAYAYAKEKGYTGTEAEYAELMASYASVAQQAGESAQTATEKAQQASASATSASQSASSASASAQTAQTAQQTASTKASEAQQSAQTATTKAQEASQSASESSQSASAASGYATAAGQAKTAAETAQGLAEQAQTNAESAKDDAESARDTAQQIVSGISGKVEQIVQNTADIASLEADRYKAYVADTATGTVASFSDGADNVLMDSVKVKIEPVQDLNGQDAPYPAGGKGNLFQTTATSKTENGITWTVNADGSVTASGTPTNYSFIALGEAIVDGISESVTIHVDVSSTYNIEIGNITLYDANNTQLVRIYDGGFTTTHTVDLSQYSNPHRITVILKRNNNNVAVNNTYHVQVVKGTTVGDWYPYSNICPISGWTGANVSHSGADISDATVYPITFPSEAGTVYGGTLDVITGELVVDRANIASYNGETLPSTWISDRDAYAQGATPTTGAQVVYELATPITITLTPTEIKSLLGDNNLWADTGDSTVTYRADTKLYINRKIAEAVSALS